jgi:hypothetical protein
MGPPERDVEQQNQQFLYFIQNSMRGTPSNPAPHLPIGNHLCDYTTTLIQAKAFTILFIFGVGLAS